MAGHERIRGQLAWRKDALIRERVNDVLECDLAPGPNGGKNAADGQEQKFETSVRLPGKSVSPVWLSRVGHPFAAPQLPPARPETMKQDPKRPIPASEARVGVGAKSDLELMAENEVLEGDIAMGADGSDYGAQEQRK